MTDLSAPFVRKDMSPPRRAPIKMIGMIAFLREKFFSSPFNIMMTLASTLFLWFTIIPSVKFLLVDAVWSGTDRTACLEETVKQTVGACWPFIGAKLNQLIYGFYPEAERWRVNLTFMLAALLLAPLLIPRVPAKVLNAGLFFIAFPVVAFFLLRGGGIGSFVSNSFWLDFSISSVAISLGAFFLTGGMRNAWNALYKCIAIFASTAIVVMVMRLDHGGLPLVDTRQWGGLLVTLVVSVTGIVVSMPIGILLALGRRSTVPLIRIASIAFIEFWRGVPLITVLFFATYMLPLFLPNSFTVDGLVRVLIGVAIFTGAYNSEVIRGGLQAIPRGQPEAAKALGLSYWKTTAFVVMPQALRHVIPALVNSFISLFKDTTLVLIVAIFDLLGQLRAAFTDPNWATPTTLFTGFAFTGMIYWVFCFGMSRYSLFAERRLDTNKRI